MSEITKTDAELELVQEHKTAILAIFHKLRRFSRNIKI